MKVGDAVAVNIGAATVAQAKIVELGDGTATLIIPATKVVMGVRTELETQNVPAQEGNQHAILGLENESGKDTPVHESRVEAEAAETGTVDSSATLEALNPVVPNTDTVEASPVEASETTEAGSQ